jgi:hypothetical protein
VFNASADVLTAQTEMANPRPARIAKVDTPYRTIDACNYTLQLMFYRLFTNETYKAPAECEYLYSNTLICCHNSYLHWFKQNTVCYSLD